MSDFDQAPDEAPSFSDHAEEAETLSKKKQPAKEAAVDPTEGMSNYEKFMAGAGKSVFDIGRSVDQLTGVSRLWGGKPTTQADVDEARALEAPLMKTGAGIFGNLAGTVAATAVPAGAAARIAPALAFLNAPQSYGAAAAGGAALGGLLTPVGSQDAATLRVGGGEGVQIPGRAVNAALGAAGGVAGQALGNAIGRVAQPVSEKLSQAASRAVDILQAAGVPLDAAQRTGSAFLARMKASLSDNPFTAGKQVEFAAKQKSAFNQAILRTIGEDADAATPEVMGAAKSRIGKVFEDVQARNPISYDSHFQTALSRIENDARSTLSDQQYGVVQRQLENVLNKAVEGKSSIDGKAAQTIKTQLDRLSGSSDQAIGHHAREIRDALDDALQRTTAMNGNQADYAALHEARQQWGNMRKIENAIDKEGRGDISPARLANIVHQKANRAASIYGEGSTQLSDLAHAGYMLIPEKLPNSGTTARQVAQTLGLPGLLGGVEYARTGDPKDALGAAALGFAAPKTLQMLINNPTVAGYASKGMNPGTIRSLLEAVNENPMVRRSPSVIMLQQAQR